MKTAWYWSPADHFCAWNGRETPRLAKLLSDLIPVLAVRWRRLGIGPEGYQRSRKACGANRIALSDFVRDEFSAATTNLLTMMLELAATRQKNASRDDALSVLAGLLSKFVDPLRIPSAIDVRLELVSRCDRCTAPPAQDGLCRRAKVFIAF